MFLASTDTAELEQNVNVRNLSYKSQLPTGREHSPPPKTQDVPFLRTRHVSSVSYLDLIRNWEATSSGVNPCLQGRTFPPLPFSLLKTTGRENNPDSPFPTPFYFLPKTFIPKISSPHNCL